MRVKIDVGIYLFWIIISFMKGIGLASSNPIYIACYVIGILLTFIKIFRVKYKKSEINTIGIILLIGIIDFIVGKETTILFTAIAIATLKDIDIKKILKIIFFTRIFAFIIMITSSLLGIIPNNTIEFYREGIGFVNRMTLGYSHPNLTQASFVLIVVLYVYNYYEKIDLKRVVVLELLNYLIYHFTVSRSGFFILSIFLVYVYLMKRIKIVNKNSKRLLNVTLFFSILFSFIVAQVYGENTIVDKLDAILTGRIRYMSETLKNYQIPMFSTNKYNNILFDNGYFDLIYNGGLLAFAWYIYNQIKTNKILVKNNLEREIVVTLFLFIYCITESYYASIIMNISLVFFAFYIFSYSINIDCKKKEVNDEKYKISLGGKDE
jgi:oligosaccharide repeat unit polymerase wzy